jgi:hypothetical protein
MKKPAIRFAPCPQNDFPQFIERYFRECSNRFPKIEAISGKWEFEDLIPGMSDFDTRFLCTDSMTADDWCEMSSIVGQVHLDLCDQYPEWARILEHLPGINLTWSEMQDELTYYPEYKQWSFYHCLNQPLQAQIKNFLEKRNWDFKDEYFHLKKFLLYYGPYDRSIDVPINLGVFESKYPLHSRLMHYFTPPIQSAVSIALRKTVRGKLAAIRMAKDIFPKISVFDELLELVACHYEKPHLYEEPALSKLEGRLFDALKTVAGEIAPLITVIPDAAKTPPQLWKEKIKSVKIDPAMIIFENARFSRLMKGRLFFYVNAPRHFDHLLCIRVELKRIGANFFRVPFSVFWQVIHGKKVENPAEIVQQLASDFLDEEEVRCTLEFDRLTRLDYHGREEEIARKIIPIFDGFYRALHKITLEVRKHALIKEIADEGKDFPIE